MNQQTTIMFSATQQIETAAFTSLHFPDNTKPQVFKYRTRPSRWSLSNISELQPEQFGKLCRWYADHIGFDGHLHVNSSSTSVDILHARRLLAEAKKIQPTNVMLITTGRFSSGTIDFCKNKSIQLRTKDDLLLAIMAISTDDQKKLLEHVFNA